jgi:hypothetical protein
MIESVDEVTPVEENPEPFLDNVNDLAALQRSEIWGSKR